MFKRSTRSAAGLLATVTLTLGAACMQGCVTNAATGDTQFDYFSRDAEVAIGLEAMPQMIDEYGGKVDDAMLNQYVTGIGRNLAAKTEADYPSLPWEFTVLNSPVINAFALPGGKVFVSRGLIEQMTNEAQLAGVLGHEVGHVSAEHVDKRLGRQMGLSIGAQITAAVLGAAAGPENATMAQAAGELVNQGAGVYGLKFSRDDELQADALGIRYMVKCGYNPRGQLQVMQILKQAAGGSAPPEWQSTHPAAETRIERIKKMLEGEYAHTQTNAQFEFYEERFRTQCLSRLKALPAAPKPKMTSLNPAAGEATLAGGDAFGGLSDPVLWCAVCREEAAQPQGRGGLTAVR